MGVLDRQIRECCASHFSDLWFLDPLRIVPAQFRPAALAELFPCLEELDLSDAARQVTPAGVAALASLTRLRHLVITKWGCGLRPSSSTRRQVC